MACDLVEGWIQRIHLQVHLLLAISVHTMQAFDFYPENENVHDRSCVYKAAVVQLQYCTNAKHTSNRIDLMLMPPPWTHIFRLWVHEFDNKYGELKLAFQSTAATANAHCIHAIYTLCMLYSTISKPIEKLMEYGKSTWWLVSQRFITPAPNRVLAANSRAFSLHFHHALPFIPYYKLHFDLWTCTRAHTQND